MLKQNWFKIIAIIILLMIGSFLFYWYELRPKLIKGNCAVEALNSAREKYKRENHDIDTEHYSKEARDNYYKWCLQENGL